MLWCGKMSSSMSCHHHESRVAFVNPTPNATENVGTGIPEPSLSFALIVLRAPVVFTPAPCNYVNAKDPGEKKPCLTFESYEYNPVP